MSLVKLLTNFLRMVKALYRSMCIFKLQRLHGIHKMGILAAGRSLGWTVSGTWLIFRFYTLVSLIIGLITLLSFTGITWTYSYLGYSSSSWILMYLPNLDTVKSLFSMILSLLAFWNVIVLSNHYHDIILLIQGNDLISILTNVSAYLYVGNWSILSSFADMLIKNPGNILETRFVYGLILFKDLLVGFTLPIYTLTVLILLVE